MLYNLFGFCAESKSVGEREGQRGSARTNERERETWRETKTKKKPEREKEKGRKKVRVCPCARTDQFRVRKQAIHIDRDDCVTERGPTASIAVLFEAGFMKHA